MNHDAIRHVLSSDYGIDGDIRELPGEHDLNFRIVAPSARYVLKVMRVDCEPALVDMQAGALAHAAKAGLGDCIPTVIPTRDGKPWTHMADANGAHRIVWLTAFLPGTLMADVAPWTPALAASIGHLLGRLDRALAGFEHPLLERELKWDLGRAGWIAGQAQAIADRKRHDRVNRIASRFTQELEPRLRARPASVLHNDANERNILATRSGASWQASGIIDFGDLIHAPRVCEPAIAMAYAMQGPGDPLVRAAALAAAYHKAWPLADEDLGLLAPLVELRLAVSVTNAAMQRRDRPENPYLTISEAPAWRVLDYLDALGEKTFAEAIQAACSGADPTASHTAKKSLLARRRRVALGNQSLSYDNHLHLVRGSRHFLYDADGNEYLDAYNNVPHVGHGHPHVVEAVTRQMRTLNTNTRYLQDIHVDYAERMLARLPEHLTKIVFLSSGSEANELALRLARAATGARDMIVMDHCYHGNTTGAMDISPYKFKHPRSLAPAPDWVHIAPQPDVYRGIYRGAGAAEKYVAAVREIVDGMAANNRKPAGFISECVPSVGGQIVLPTDYLNAVFASVRAAGGICIADDVQTGLGRLGHWFWGFEQQACAPDVVVWGKPLGNGFPLSAVTMTDAVADAFARGPEFFATFGGSSAACAAGRAVLDVLDAEALPARARATGEFLLAGLHELARRHELIGDVRGFGLFLGVDLVRDRTRREAATGEAGKVVNLLREKRVLIGLEGPENNVLKIRPPMSFDRAGAEQLLQRLDEALHEVGDH